MPKAKTKPSTVLDAGCVVRLNGAITPEILDLASVFREVLPVKEEPVSEYLCGSEPGDPRIRAKVQGVFSTMERMQETISTQEGTLRDLWARVSMYENEFGRRGVIGPAPKIDILQDPQHQCYRVQVATPTVSTQQVIRDMDLIMCDATEKEEKLRAISTHIAKNLGRHIENAVLEGLARAFVQL